MYDFIIFTMTSCNMLHAAVFQVFEYFINTDNMAHVELRFISKLSMNLSIKFKYFYHFVIEMLD